MIQVLMFCLLSFGIFRIAWKGFSKVYFNIMLGRDEHVSGNKGKRIQQMLLFALGQKKMFERPVSGIFHFFIYAAFIFTQIELIEIISDGISGHHRIFAEPLGKFYNFLINFIEILSLLALAATLIFLSRRNIIRLLRFQKPELRGWPSMDANLILLGEILLIIAIFTMNSADQQLQILEPNHYPSTGRLYLSGLVTDHLNSFPKDYLVFMERAGWWIHVLVIYGFIIYLPYSKHLHIFLAFPNSYFSRIEPRGSMSNIPEIENEVRGMFGLATQEIISPRDSFGASDVTELSWRQLLEAYSCTECGRCTSVCPANLTGKKLSPRAVMMSIRDRAEELGEFRREHKDNNAQDGKNLFDYISREEIYACTSCNACVEACPVLINPLIPILEMRRSDILMNSKGPSDWLPMFNSLENNQSVWSMSEARDAWKNH
ncbi:MAG: (Fe-S)-binding protein [Saprospiraceae bacterium]|nr:(Fe-S)-binding protein [Saprospiraceae bacterium]HMW40200.1 (Fe-S)-binding protein [Saprospiraceae bacterium]HMX88819.1 (Fe-S)-binding protein [Saprospiraceae bacterium]HMZ39103.1 (Fe-S)-binding protein [Saprospiraceae bacterium]HNA65266.1 (Fe-S)-binding protein [Saprospiraceae bacterium]